MWGFASAAWKCFMLYILVANLNICETKPTHGGMMMRGKELHNREPEDPEVSRMLQELFGSDASSSKRYKRSCDVESDSLAKSSKTEMKGGSLPLIEFEGIGKKDSRSMLEKQKEMSRCLRLAREAQAKLKYLWNKMSNGKSPVEADGTFVGTEKSLLQDRNPKEVQVPLSLQVGGPNMKA